MMWDANADIEALLKDYYTKFYGPAAKDMHKKGYANLSKGMYCIK